MSERNWWIDLTARMIIQPVSGTIQQLNRGKARATYIGRVSKTWLTWLHSVATKGTDNNTFLSRPSILPCGSPDETIHHLLPRESDIVRIFSSSGGSDLLQIDILFDLPFSFLRKRNWNSLWSARRKHCNRLQ